MRNERTATVNCRIRRDAAVKVGWIPCPLCGERANIAVYGAEIGYECQESAAHDQLVTVSCGYAEVKVTQSMADHSRQMAYLYGQLGITRKLLLPRAQKHTAKRF